MQVTLYVQMNPSNLRWIKPEEVTIEKLVGQCTFSTYSFGDYIQLGAITVDVELDLSGFTDKAVSSLRIKQSSIRAKATAECTEIEGMVQHLLCIEMAPAPAETEEDRLVRMAFEHGFEIKKDTESDYYMWSSRGWVEDSPATFDTPADAVLGLLAHLCLDKDGLPI